VKGIRLLLAEIRFCLQQWKVSPLVRYGICSRSMQPTPGPHPPTLHSCLIEDDKDMRELVRGTWNTGVFTRECGEDGIKEAGLAMQTNPDLILLDR